ncbi:hypothetical protein BOTBODRAFT_38602 [Botryobasidium botryosum FD-172 SS1]|uniref:Cytochrome P450 n=1 Tax=Botryobasidium botryosum (strain FD-172 SS1) TaxID=930990 RepID=A0A067LWF6_BOTB1|nr:hypothetical protein BOTBODRAFT_38602 [Botryobasidium botryosum FD-172 SS1]
MAPSLTHPIVISLALFPVFLLCRRIVRALNNRYTSDIRYISRPDGGHWLWGHELEPFSRLPGETYAKWLENHGSLVRISGAFGHDDILVVADTGVLAHILTKRPYAYPKSSMFRSFFLRISGRGLVWAEGEDHRRMRSTLNPVFSASEVRNMYEDVKLCSDRMTLLLTKYLNNNGGDAAIQVPEWTTKVALDIIGRVGFGHDFDFGKSAEAKQISTAWTKMLKLNMSRNGAMAPIVLRNFPIIDSLPISALKSQGTINRIITGLAEKLFVKETLDPESIKGRDLLSTLLRENRSGRTAISKEELLDQISTFVTAGHETTAATLNLILLTLAQNPDIQDKMRRELVDFGTEPTYDDFLAKLPYLDAVVKEGLRMFPAGPSTERIAAEDDALPLRKPIQTPDGRTLTSIRIKRGQVIIIPTMSINRDNAVWGDGWTFRPERWLSPDQLPAHGETTQGWSQTLTFLQGPRMCIGFRLVILELKVVLSSLIKTFVLHDTGAEVEPVIAVNLQARIVGEEGVRLPLRFTFAEPELRVQ